MTESNRPRGTEDTDRLDDTDNLGRGADGDTTAREQQRVALGERKPDAGQEGGDTSSP